MREHQPIINTLNSYQMKAVNSTKEWIDTFPNQPIVYLMLTDIWSNNWVYAKIGKTTQLPIRHPSIEAASGRKLRVDHCFNCLTSGLMDTNEQSLHNLFKEFRVKGEWFWLPVEAVRFIRRLQGPHDLMRLWHEGELQALRHQLGSMNRPAQAA